MLGVIAPILAVATTPRSMSPMAFLARPARWMEWLATKPCAYSAAPNFAFELAVRKTSDEDLAGLDLEWRADHRHRQRARPSGHPEEVCRPVRQIRLPGEHDHAVLWHGRGHGVRVDPRGGRRSLRSSTSTRRSWAPVPPSGVARPGAGSPAHQLWRAALALPSGSSTADTLEGVSRRAPSAKIWTTGDNVSAGYWNKPEETHAHLRRGDRRPRPPTRRPGRGCAPATSGSCPNRRAVHRRPHQGSADRVRAQPLRRGHRGHHAGDHRRPSRGDLGQRRPHGETGGHRGGQEAQ